VAGDRLGRDGYTLDTRPCTVAEWGERLRDDIAARPEFYFARVEVARLDQDLDEFAAELWDLQHQVRQAQLERPALPDRQPARAARSARTSTFAPRTRPSASTPRPRVSLSSRTSTPS
jgi:hypothetical protein